MRDNRPARILMVDDRPENLLALEAILHGLGHELVSANSGEDALKRLLSEEFALILLDVQMPGMDGFETAAHIKQRARTRDIPIVFLTAMEGEAHQAFRGYTAGAVDFLAKPFDPWVLRAKVAVFIELDERRRELAARADDLRHRLTALDPAELDRLASEVCGALGRARALCDAPAAPAPTAATDMATPTAATDMAALTAAIDMAALTAAIDMAALTAAIDMAARSACELRDSLSHDGRTTPTSGPTSGSASRLTSESGFGDPTR